MQGYKQWNKTEAWILTLLWWIWEWSSGLHKSFAKDVSKDFQKKGILRLLMKGKDYSSRLGLASCLQLKFSPQLDKFKSVCLQKADFL